jgi:rfaE bifunctional protein nucleotidyltransferase chain/domain/rfaE bifunctional protein kinase chain/domain
MSRGVRLTVVGDVVLDRDLVGSVDRVCPDAPVPVVDVISERTSPGGAGLTALLAAADGADVTLVAPLADDAAGRLLRADLEAAGITLVALPQQGATREKSRVRAAGQSLLRVDRGGPAAPVGALGADARRAVDGADVVLVSCYGAGTGADAEIRAALADRARRAPVLWDPHPRGPSPVAGCVLVTPNLAEARDLVDAPEAPPGEVACTLVARWDADAVAVTCGAEGAWVARRSGELERVAAEPVTGDPCGAGDCFAATAAIAVGAGADPGTAVRAAVASASSFVALGGSAGWRDSVSRPSTEGRTVVATGGCFDILHAGHVETLTAARALGDELVVLLNSDRSVRRLKGTSRPLNPCADRAAVLRALTCVDRVVVFDEDTPVDALRALRPDVWVKGGDYEVEDLPETPVVRSWGGRVEVLTHLPGRSSTATIHRLTQGGHRAS